METTEKTKRIPEDKKETPEDKFEIKAYLEDVSSHSSISPASRPKPH